MQVNGAAAGGPPLVFAKRQPKQVQIGGNRGPSLAPSVPGADALLDQSEMLGIRHSLTPAQIGAGIICYVSTAGRIPRRVCVQAGHSCSWDGSNTTFDKNSTGQPRRSSAEVNGWRTTGTDLNRQWLQRPRRATAPAGSAPSFPTSPT